MATTRNIRTWKRRSTDTTLPVEERVKETTNPADMQAAIEKADFITIPRESYTTSGQKVHDGYPKAYTQRLSQVLREEFGYSGHIRQSRSGRSHVFERESAAQGAAYDFGVEPRASVAPLPSTDLRAA